MQYLSLDMIFSVISIYGIKVLTAIAIFIIGFWCSKFFKNFAKKLMIKSNIDESLISFISNILYILVIILVIIASLDQLGINTTSIAAVIAAAGLAIGLSLQGSLSNFASGVLIIVLKPFKIGDFIEASSLSGTVSEIGILTTILKTGDNKTIIIPNTSIMSGTITNFSVEPTRRIDMSFEIGYENNINKVIKIIDSILKEDKRVLSSPEARIAVSGLGENSVHIISRPWVNKENYWDVFYDLQQKIKEAFDKNKITIPSKERKIHLYNKN